MQLIEAFQRLPMAFKIIWILALALVFVSAITTMYNSFYLSEEQASPTELNVERPTVAGEEDARGSNDDDDNIDDRSYGEGPRRREIDTSNDASREFEEDSDENGYDNE